MADKFHHTNKQTNMIIIYRPCQLTDAIHHRLSTVESEVKEFAEQASKDWVTILLHRAKELVPGRVCHIYSLIDTGMVPLSSAHHLRDVFPIQDS